GRGGGVGERGGGGGGVGGGGGGRGGEGGGGGRCVVGGGGEGGVVGRVWVVDDEADVLYSFRRVFDSPEIELITASSGEEGLKLLARVRPDLVIMDVRRGGMNAFEMLRRIRQSDAKLPVTMMTAYGTTQTAIDATTLGA